MTAMVSDESLFRDFNPRSSLANLSCFLLLLPPHTMLLDSATATIRSSYQVGWGATTGFAEDWTWQQSADLYALDPEMSARLRKSNPQVRVFGGGLRDFGHTIHVCGIGSRV